MQESTVGKALGHWSWVMQQQLMPWVIQQFETFEQRSDCEAILSSSAEDVVTDTHPTAGMLATLIDLARESQQPAALSFIKALELEWAALVAEHRIDCDVCIHQDKQEAAADEGWGTWS